MLAPLTQSPPSIVLSSTQRGPCSRYVGTRVCLEPRRKRRGTRILSPNPECSPTPTPSQWAFRIHYRRQCWFKMSQGSGLQWMGVREGKGKRDRRQVGPTQGHPGLMSREAENHR